MKIPLSLHLFIHFALAALVGYLVGWYFGVIWLGLIAGILGGFFIDLDHVLEYFIVFGLRFNLKHFLEGRQFLSSDKMYIWFHAWEYVPVFLAAVWLFWHYQVFNVAIFLLALTIGAFVHLVSDCFINHFPARNYSLINRWRHGFYAPRLLRPEQYQHNLEQKKRLNLA